MGVPQLWRMLQKETAVTTLDGRNPEQHAEVAADVDGKKVAVDLSVWMMQAQQSQKLQELFGDETAQILKVVFERTIHWLRYGCTPVFVVEGHTPAEKQEAVRARFGASGGFGGSQGGNREGSFWRQLSRQVVVMLHALGLTSVQAEGEGEAMCGALNSLGLVDACCTVDVDVLLYGATVVYRELQLSTTSAQGCKSVKCEMEAVRQALGIERGGEFALLALARLIGCDYDLGGVDNVGQASAWKAVQHLLRGKEDDDDILDRLDEALRNGPDAHYLNLTKCTGCKACGHESHLKTRPKKHNKAGCKECGTHTGEQGGCIPRDFSLDACTCAFHRSSSERLFAKVIEKAVASGGGTSASEEVYLQEACKARRAAALYRDTGALGWVRRPDVHALHAALAPLGWNYDVIRKKVLVLLMEWDVRQGPQPSTPSSVEFLPVGIKSVTRKVTKGGEEGESSETRESWTYLLKWERIRSNNMRDVQLDIDWLKSSPSHSRSARRSVVAEQWPEMVKAFEEANDNKGKKSRAGRGRAAQKGKVSKGVSLTEVSEQTQRMQSVMFKFLQQGAKTAGNNRAGQQELDDDNTSHDESDDRALLLSQETPSVAMPEPSSQLVSLMSSQTQAAMGPKYSIPGDGKMQQLLPHPVTRLQDSELAVALTNNRHTLSRDDAVSVSRPKPVSRLQVDLTGEEDEGGGRNTFIQDQAQRQDQQQGGGSQQGRSLNNQKQLHDDQTELLVEHSTLQTRKSQLRNGQSQHLNTTCTASSLSQPSSTPQTSVQHSRDLDTSQVLSQAGERAMQSKTCTTLQAAVQPSATSTAPASRYSGKTKKTTTSSHPTQATPITKFFSRAAVQPPSKASMTHAESDGSVRPPIACPSFQQSEAVEASTSASMPTGDSSHALQEIQRSAHRQPPNTYLPTACINSTHAHSPSKRSMPPLATHADPMDSPSPSKRIHISAPLFNNTTSSQTPQSLPSSLSSVIDLVTPSPPPKPAVCSPASRMSGLYCLSGTQEETTTFQPASLIHRFSSEAQPFRPAVGESRSMSAASFNSTQPSQALGLKPPVYDMIPVPGGSQDLSQDCGGERESQNPTCHVLAHTTGCTDHVTEKSGQDNSPEGFGMGERQNAGLAGPMLSDTQHRTDPTVGTVSWDDRPEVLGVGERQSPKLIAPRSAASEGRADHTGTTVEHDSSQAGSRDEESLSLNSPVSAHGLYRAHQMIAQVVKSLETDEHHSTGHHQADLSSLQAGTVTPPAAKQPLWLDSLLQQRVSGDGAEADSARRMHDVIDLLTPPSKAQGYVGHHND